MTTLRWPDGRGHFVDRDSDRAPGDGVLDVPPGGTVDVDDTDTVDHYLTRGFERVDDGADGSAPDDSAEEPASDDADPRGDDAETDFDVDGFDTVDDFISRTPVSDVVDDIESGMVDDYLPAVADADDRVTVQRAVDNRQEAIGGD